MGFLKNIASSQTDSELVQQYAASGDMQMLGELYQRYMDLVYGVCLKYLKEPEDARDAVLNIFEELIVKLQKHKVEQFRSWLHQVAKNHCLMRLRSEKGKTGVKIDLSIVQSEETMHQEDAWERESHFNGMEDCLAQLPPKQRQVVELFYLQSKCYKEITAVTGVEWNQVRSFIQNGRRNLKSCMEKRFQKTAME
ncbi:MAG: polymerase sigma70 factor [Flaviaesturariibacter sp.]|nr:polymerase sigma70 factor [Flaviaesturariibacter sp.]